MGSQGIRVVSQMALNGSIKTDFRERGRFVHLTGTEEACSEEE